MFEQFCNMDSYISAPNLSNGFHGILFEYINKYYKSRDSILLIAENNNINYIFKNRFPGIIIYNNEYEGNIGQKFTDLNVSGALSGSFNFVFSQALLEHICRPDIALENMVNVTTIGGHIIIHTQNPQMAYHKCPVDCLRFFKDWFIEMQKYLPIKLVEWNEFGPHMFCVYERVA